MDGSPAPAPQWRLWPLAVLVVTLGQAGLALHLFGLTDRVEGLTDSRPIVSGRHPLHLYHGSLGAATFHDCYSTSCFDPAFQAGYPKTPVFDGGARPAELFQVFASDPDNPAAYKIGLFMVCLLVPVTFAGSGRGLGLSPAGACLAAVGGCLVWWSPSVRTLLDEGNLDLLIAGLAGLACVSGLARYASDPGPLSWCLLAGTAVVGWYAHPVAWLGMMPVVAAFYIVLAPRHGLGWHLGLLGTGIAGVVPNLWWLCDWFRFWWLRQPGVDDLAPLPSWSLLLGDVGDYANLPGPGVVGWAAVVGGLCGLLGMMRAGLRTQAGLVAVAAAVAVVAARLGATWPTMQAFGADRATGFAPTILVIPAAWLLGHWWEQVEAGAIAVWGAIAVPLAFGWLGITAPVAVMLELNLHPLTLGLTPDQEQFVAALKLHTTPEARILIEESDTARAGWNWTALLPALTDRTYLGGLDPDAGTEYSFCRQCAGKLNGRAFAEWQPHEREQFCRRYNVGWVVCRTAQAADWWARDPATRELGRFRDGDDVLVLYEVTRVRSFVLTGTATVERADRRKLVLTDVVPNEAGEVVLSFHHQPGLRAAPSTIGIEGDKDLFDPIAMVKLVRLPGPVSRVTLTWENP